METKNEIIKPEQQILDYIAVNEHIYITGKRKNKFRHFVDMRCYVVFILIVKYNYTPNNIADLFKVDRALYYNILGKVPYLLNNAEFIKHVEDLVHLFPYSETDVQTAFALLDKIKNNPNRNASKKEKFNYNVFGLTKEDLKKLGRNQGAVAVIKKLIKELK